MKATSIKEILFWVAGAVAFLAWDLADAIAANEPYAKVVDVVPTVDEDSDSRASELMSGLTIAKIDVRPGPCVASKDDMGICKLPTQ